MEIWSHLKKMYIDLFFWNGSSEKMKSLFFKKILMADKYGILIHEYHNFMFYYYFTHKF